MKKLLLLFCILVVYLSGCATRGIPSQFSTTMSQNWSSIEIRDEVEYNRAWSTLYSILVRDFDIDYASKSDGYIRTLWMNNWSGLYQEYYKVKISCKFSDDHKKLEIKPEAMAFNGHEWILGVDTRLTSTLKTDIMGTIGRTTR